MNGNLLGELHLAINKVYARKNLDLQTHQLELAYAIAEFFETEGVEPNDLTKAKFLDLITQHP